MDDIFLRELVIFLIVLAVFVGAVPVMIKGHHAEPVEQANDVANAGAATGTAARGMSKRRKARARDAQKKNQA